MARLNGFDKFCGVLAVLLAIGLLLLGGLGLFLGCSANFTLPPILGVLPALVGWGIVRAVWVAWTNSSLPPTTPGGFPVA